MKIPRHMSFLLACLLLFALPALAAPPRVVVSIKPLHSLVAGVMQGIAEPALLVKGGGTPHGYSLRPSEARLLADADLLVWVGPELESFLATASRTLSGKARQLRLAEQLAGQLLPARAGGDWAEHTDDDDNHGHGQHAHDADHADDDRHEHAGDNDPHLWLSPLLAGAIVDQTVAVLSELDPANQGRYRDNADAVRQRLDRLHAELRERLTPVREVPYIVFHDAYQYFEQTYGLNALGSLTISPERKPGARRISAIRDRIRVSGARCVFSEPQFEPKLVKTVVTGTGAGTGVLDPLGADLPAGPEHYFQLLDSLAASLLAGLTPSRQADSAN
ncbi:MAG: zinc ABC transporter substrate-binding protein [Desulfuromonadales bacterium]|nr:zinc ABC transporter substrate-binding protein [Desulfuromonadales bacterium]